MICYLAGDDGRCITTSPTAVGHHARTTSPVADHDTLTTSPTTTGHDTLTASPTVTGHDALTASPTVTGHDARHGRGPTSETVHAIYGTARLVTTLTFPTADSPNKTSLNCAKRVPGPRAPG